MAVKRTYNFGPDQIAAIDALASELCIDKQQVLREGLRLVRVAVRERAHGNMLAVVNGTSVVHRLLGPWDELKGEGEAAA